MTARPLLLFIPVILNSCDAEGDPASAEIGTGTVAFELLEVDQRLGIVAGPQGGHHFIIHARMSGLSPGDPTMPGLSGNPRTLFSAFAEGGEQVDAGHPPHRLGYRRQPDGSYELPSGRLLILDPEDPTLPDRLYDRPVRVTVAIEDSKGKTAVDARWVTAVEYLPEEAEEAP